MNTSVCRIAAIQMVSGPDVDRNLADADRLIGEAAAAGARVAVLPEYFPLITGDETAKVRIREHDGEGPLQAFLRDAARRHKLWLIGGSCPMAADSPDKVKNSTLVFDDNGRRVARYDKVHLFGFCKGEERYDEAATIEAGNEVVSFEAPCGQIGLSICYDLRFPELFRAMGELDLIVLPAAFTYTTGQAHWEILLRARAIENQCYVLASAQGGRHPSGRRTWGDSMIIDPWGRVLACQDSGQATVLAKMEPGLVDELKRTMPVLQHARLL